MTVYEILHIFCLSVYVNTIEPLVWDTLYLIVRLVCINNYIRRKQSKQIIPRTRQLDFRQETIAFESCKDFNIRPCVQNDIAPRVLPVRNQHSKCGTKIFVELSHI